MVKRICLLGIFLFFLSSCATEINPEMELERYIRSFDDQMLDEPITVGLYYQLNSAEDGYVWLSGAKGSSGKERIVLPLVFNGSKGQLPVTAVKGVREIALFFESVLLSSSIVELQESAFEMATELISVENVNNIRSIGNRAFFGCESLQSFKMPPSLDSIGNSAFANCRKLEISELPSSVSQIGTNAFAFCSSITSFRIGENVTTLGAGVFDSCVNLTDIYCEASSAPAGWSAEWLENCTATVHWGQ